jgi:hypothetical protein
VIFLRLIIHYKPRRGWAHTRHRNSIIRTAAGNPTIETTSLSEIPRILTSILNTHAFHSTSSFERLLIDSWKLIKDVSVDGRSSDLSPFVVFVRKVEEWQSATAGAKEDGRVRGTWFWCKTVYQNRSKVHSFNDHEETELLGRMMQSFSSLALWLLPGHRLLRIHLMIYDDRGATAVNNVKISHNLTIVSCIKFWVSTSLLTAFPSPKVTTSDLNTTARPKSGLRPQIFPQALALEKPF